MRRGYDTTKRILDLLLASLALILLMPLILCTAATVFFFLGRPVLFRQVRPGRGGEPFQMIKFRTMTDEVDAEGSLLPDAQRLTGVGRALRAWSLDELPELINVIKGDMSLVGPRPLLMEYVALYSGRQARRQEVPPGITGWAQVHGRNTLGWEDRLELDVWYVDNRSLWLDFKILLRTIGKVVVREGVSQAGHATMERFRGAKSGSDQS